MGEYACALGPILVLGLALAIPPFIMWTISRLAWAKVARAYPETGPRPAPLTYLGYGVFNGWIGYKGCLIIGADADALYVRSWPVFNFFHPAFRVPWSEMSLGKTRILWADYVRVSFKSVPGVTLALRAGTFQTLRPAFTTAGLVPPA